MPLFVLTHFKVQHETKNLGEKTQKLSVSYIGGSLFMSAVYDIPVHYHKLSSIL